MNFRCITAYICVKERHSLWLTSVVDSCDGVSVEHAVEEGVGVFRELEDDKKRGIKYSSQTATQRTHIHARTHPYTHTEKRRKTHVARGLKQSFLSFTAKL